MVGRLAQSVERRLHTAEVAGSIPVPPTIRSQGVVTVGQPPLACLLESCHPIPIVLPAHTLLHGDPSMSSPGNPVASDAPAKKYPVVQLPET